MLTLVHSSSFKLKPTPYSGKLYDVLKEQKARLHRELQRIFDSVTEEDQWLKIHSKEPGS